MLKQTNEIKSFTKQTIKFFNSKGTPSERIFRALLKQYSGLSLFEEEGVTNLVTQGIQIYSFGNAQIFWVPKMTVPPLFTSNRIDAVVTPQLIMPVKNNVYNYICKVKLTISFEHERYVKFFGLKFGVYNASELDFLILGCDLKEIEAFIKRNSNGMNKFLNSSSKLKVVSYPDATSRAKIFVFNNHTKVHDLLTIDAQDLTPITTNISTLDLVLLLREHNLQIYSMLITEFILILHTDPIVLEQFINLLKTQQSYFDSLRAKSKLMDSIINILDLSISRNGKSKVDRWIDDVKLGKYLSASDAKALDDYIFEKFEADDIEKQMPSVKVRKLQPKN